MKLFRRPEPQVVEHDRGITINYAVAADRRRDTPAPGPSAFVPKDAA